MQRVYTALLFVVACGIALALAETTLRWVAPSGYFVWQPNLAVTFTPTMPGLKGESHFVINESGVRGRSFSNDDRFRILTIGGSTTECLYLDETEAWPHLLEAKLDGRFHPSPVWVGNVGKSGHTSAHHVLQAQKLLDQYPHIDLVTVLVGTNDMTGVGQNGKYVPLNDIETSLAFAVYPGDARPTESGLPYYKRTELWRTLRKIKEGWLAGRNGELVQDTDGAVYEKLRRNRKNATRYLDTFPDLSIALTAYAKNLNAIVDAAEAHGTNVVFATQPSLWADNLPQKEADLLWMGRVGKYSDDSAADYYSAGTLARAMQTYNDALLQVCRERSLECLDLAAEVPKNAEMFYDDVHFTEAGSQVVAAAFARFLLENEVSSDGARPKTVASGRAAGEPTASSAPEPGDAPAAARVTETVVASSAQR